ncbi:MAG TPA: HPr kinase/phosphatase C-terminal domain-containing protein [Pyrinomonadaceae bacterium]|nr:HPr kinase/phosphatase C-terminal domain-containing protein [Pyrinomonadaceae bacterium]
MQSVDQTPDPPANQPPPFQIHGVLVRVLDTGVLMVGESGSGKSQCAFDLIRKGYQLVADDVVEVFEKDGCQWGRPTDFTRGLMEIRGMGIVDVGRMLGEDVLCPESTIDLYVEISESPAVDRFGAVKHEHTLGNHTLPKFVFPSRSAGGLASLIVEAVQRLSVGNETSTAVVEQGDQLQFSQQ